MSEIKVLLSTGKKVTIENRCECSEIEVIVTLTDVKDDENLTIIEKDKKEEPSDTQEELTLEDLDVRIGELEDRELESRPRNHVGH